jgi:beta-glucosidase-like glycosyl hydrolase
MVKPAARLLFPALRWHADTGFAHEAAAIDNALAVGVGGFIIFGGNAHAVRELTESLHTGSAHPILIAADLERGAGQQFAGATMLPPLAAIGYLDDLAVTRAAGEMTGREARALGVNWIYAPVADVDLEPDNPIVGTRAFGSDAATVARHVGAWIDGCHAAGALACAKHFPGHGRTTTDSHAELPRVTVSRNDLDADLAPFRAAIIHRADSIMTAHVSFPALDMTGAAATLSRPIITDLLRNELRYPGMVITDALIMDGVRQAAGDECEAAIRALMAGCDALLYPSDLNALLAAIDAAIAAARLPQKRIDESTERIQAAVERPSDRTGLWGLDRDRDWALDVALRAVHVVRGQPQLSGNVVTLVTIDDDLGSPYAPPARDAFARTLVAAGYQVRDVDSNDASASLVAVYADIRAWKGRPGLSPDAAARLRAAIAADTTVVLFGHPRLAAEFPGHHIMAAWGGEQLMQEAAALWLHKARVQT